MCAIETDLRIRIASYSKVQRKLDDAGVALILNLCEGKDMDKIIETREIPIKGEYDIIIAGGGIAGVAAALAAKGLAAGFY